MQEEKKATTEGIDSVVVPYYNISGIIWAELCRIVSNRFPVWLQNRCSWCVFFPSSNMNCWKCSLILSHNETVYEICAMKFMESDLHLVGVWPILGSILSCPSHQDPYHSHYSHIQLLVPLSSQICPKSLSSYKQKQNSLLNFPLPSS